MSRPKACSLAFLRDLGPDTMSEAPKSKEDRTRIHALRRLYHLSRYEPEVDGCLGRNVNRNVDSYGNTLRWLDQGLGLEAPGRLSERDAVRLSDSVDWS